MLDAVTLDQLRAFVLVAEEGSFSAAARSLKRVQSAVSTAMANLENQLAVPLWDRSKKAVALTDQGRVVLTAARRVLSELDGLQRLTAGLSTGLEASVSLCLDAFFPLRALIDLCAAFRVAFPSVELRVSTEVMSVVSARVRDGSASLGVVSPAGLLGGLETVALSAVNMIPVVSAGHALAEHKGRIAQEHFADEIQIVLSEGVDGRVADQAVLSTRTWRVGDLYTKHAMLRAGLGWGNLPEHLAHEDLKRGALVRIQPAAWGVDQHRLYLTAIYRSDTLVGPAHRWVLGKLATLCARETAPHAKKSPKTL